MSKFQFQLHRFETKYGKVEKFNRALRRFKRRYLTSKKKKQAESDAFHAALRATFTVAPATYYQDQPH